jgi:uncharacterized protein (TIGR02145 family)
MKEKTGCYFAVLCIIIFSCKPVIINQDDETQAYVDELNKQITNLENTLIAGGRLVKDFDGNIYNTVRIGSQIWMAENLRVTKYNDGTPIPLVTDPETWASLLTPGYSWYNNDEAIFKDLYGALYNWYAVNTGKLCPTGWHIPTDGDWAKLTTYLGGERFAGGKLKEVGNVHWPYDNIHSTNETGFTAIPGGNRAPDGSFSGYGNYCVFWSTTEYDQGHAWSWAILAAATNIWRDNTARKWCGFSVRCVKD